MKPPTPGFAFEVVATDGAARVGRLGTPRGVVETPAFMPVGTQGTVKGLLPSEVEATGARCCLANTYHLWLRPGAELVASLGGLHRFMRWPHVILTDSGGYQVFSLASLRRIDDDGVWFRSHLDGSPRRLSPEESMRVQALLGSDIAMVLDVCPPADADRDELDRAVARTSTWARRCLAAPAPDGQARFGIVQGGMDLALRRRHLDEVCAMSFDGVALGGFSVGEPPAQRWELVGELGPRLDPERPRYLMGVGTPADLLHAVAAGIDLFDCVLPTRNGRNGQAFTWRGRVNLRQARHRADGGPLDARCDCLVCHTFSRAYLRHLFVAGEMLGPRLVSLHNLHFYAALLREARRAIAEGSYGAFVRRTLCDFEEGDEIGGSASASVPSAGE
ncbi:MAG: tRNA guanosine(34) transglycosylase Tgt [Myxococcota bacterium]|nr:tRNA guanosine(34) transglycosylase Tgt [Myxococcota bacterium]MDW8363838.1 tRNA guanosine(34) transglycosylase Tgt [Myxococcales bacterium]